MCDTRKALISGIWYTASNFLVKSIVFITTPIFARLLSHDQFGYYNNFISWMSVLIILVTLNLDSTFISAKFDFKEDFDVYTSSVLALSSLSGILWIIGINIFSDIVSTWTSINITYLNLLIIYIIALSSINIFQSKSRYEYKYKCFVLVSASISILTTILSILLVCIMNDRLAGRILGSIIPSIIIGLILYILLINQGKKINLKYWKYSLPICIPYIPHLLSMSLLHSTDRIMITKMCGADQNALYSLANTCGIVILILISSLNSAFSPWLGSKLHSESYSEIKIVTIKYIILFFFLVVLIMLIAPEILLFMGGKSYMVALYVIPPIIFGCSCQFLYTLYVNIEQYKRRTIGMALASICSALLNFYLNLIMIPRYGYIGAAYTTVISFLWLLAMHMLLVLEIGYINIFPTKLIIIILIFMCIYTFAVNFIYSFVVIRYIFIIFNIIALIIYINCIRLKFNIKSTV